MTSRSQRIDPSSRLNLLRISLFHIVLLFLLIARSFAFHSGRLNNWDGILCSGYCVCNSIVIVIVIIVFVVFGLLDDGAVDRFISGVSLSWRRVALILVFLWVGITLYRSSTDKQKGLKDKSQKCCAGSKAEVRLKGRTELLINIDVRFYGKNTSAYSAVD